MINRLSYRFYLPEAGKDKVTSPLFLRIIVDRKKAELSTGIRIKPSTWDEATQLCQRNPRANAELTHLANRLLELKHDLVLQGKPFTATQLKALLLDKPAEEHSLLHYFRARVDRLRSRPDVSPNTVKCYSTSLKHVTAYLTQSKNLSLSILQVDVKWLAGFDHFLCTQVNPVLNRPIHRNAINKNHSHLRSILNLAEREELIERNPYRRFKLKNERTTRSFLSSEELGKLAALELELGTALDRVRDIFLFSVYTGLRYSDAIKLTLSNVTEHSGSAWLKLVQEKTGDVVNIPLLSEAARILAKYASAGHREIKDLLLPPISNQKLNKHLHELAARASLGRSLTHHVARHTFATTITLANDVPIEVVSKLLGHRDLATTQIYAKITTDHLARVASQLELRLQKNIQV